MARMKWTERYVKTITTSFALTHTGLLVSMCLLTERLFQHQSGFKWPALVSSIIGGIASLLAIFSIGRHYYYIARKRLDKRNWMLSNIPGLGVLVQILWMFVSIGTIIALAIKVRSLPKPFRKDWSIIYILAAAVFWFLMICAEALWMSSIGPLSEETKRVLAARKEQKEAQRRAAGNVGVSTNPDRDTDLEMAKPAASSNAFGIAQDSPSNEVRPISSKNRLVGQASSRQRQSNDSRDAEAIDEGFDSWDTSAVETPAWHSPGTSVGGNGTPSGGKSNGIVLETIPASPSASTRSQSPTNPFDPPPPIGGGSYGRSPPMDTSRCASPTGSEKHIHPLFRSDSPTPPPTARATSSITAAPNAGQAIAEATVRQKRSGSTPVPSPLFHSVHTFANTNPSSRRGEPGDNAEIDEEQRDRSKASLAGDRVMTPPIPDWVLSAGQRNEREATGRGEPW